MSDSTKTTFRQKAKVWFEDHPQAVLIGTYVMAMTGIVTVSMFNTNRQRIETNKQVLKSEKLMLDNNTLLADRQDKANTFAADAAAAGHVVHTLTNGNLISVPGDVPQKIHFV